MVAHVQVDDAFSFKMGKALGHLQSDAVAPALK